MMKRLFAPLVGLFIVVLTACGQVEMSGDVDYWIRGSRLHIEFERLRNLSDTPTDRLRFRVFASEHHWTPDRQGHLIAAAALPRLGAQQSRRWVHKTAHMHYPHRDWYHITVTLERGTVDAGHTTWEIADAIEFDDELFLRDPSEFWWGPFW